MKTNPTSARGGHAVPVQELRHPMTDGQVRAAFRARAKAPDPQGSQGGNSEERVGLLLEQAEAQVVPTKGDGAPVETVDALTPDALGRLFANKTCALRVPAFASAGVASKLARWLVAQGVKGKWGGTDTSYGAGLPLNAIRWSLDDCLGYFREAVPSIRRLRDAVPGRLGPVDRLRLELDELWPWGANISSDNEYRRKMFVGIGRIMRPKDLLGDISRTEGFIHNDSSLMLDPAKGFFSANIYLRVPTRGGELNVWSPAMAQPARSKETLRYIRFLLMHAFHSEHSERVQRALHRLLPAPVTIQPKAGDLIILNTGRPHAVRGFTAGYRATLQAFVHHQAGVPLLLSS